MTIIQCLIKIPWSSKMIDKLKQDGQSNEWE